MMSQRRVGCSRTVTLDARATSGRVARRYRSHGVVRSPRSGDAQSPPCGFHRAPAVRPIEGSTKLLSSYDLRLTHPSLPQSQDWSRRANRASRAPSRSRFATAIGAGSRASLCSPNSKSRIKSTRAASSSPSDIAAVVANIVWSAVPIRPVLPDVTESWRAFETGKQDNTCHCKPQQRDQISVLTVIDHESVRYTRKPPISVKDGQTPDQRI